MVIDKKVSISFSIFKLLKNIVIISCFLFLLVVIANQRTRFNQQVKLTEVANDSIHTWITKDGEKFTKIQTLQSDNAKMFLELSTNNKVVTELQQLVKNNRKALDKNGAAGIIKTQSIFNVTTDTEVIGDTYKGEYTNKWYSIKSTATPTSTDYELKTHSELSVVIGLEKQGFLKKRKPYSTVNDKNPYTDIKDMRVYQTSLPKKHKFYIGPFGGVDVRGSPILGAGIGYGLITF